MLWQESSGLLERVLTPRQSADDGVGAGLPPLKHLLVSVQGFRRKNSKMLIFLVPTHSLTMNRNMMEISTRLQSRLTFKANTKGLKTHFRWNNVCKTREGLKNQRTQTPWNFQQRRVKVLSPTCATAYGTAVASYPRGNEYTS